MPVKKGPGRWPLLVLILILASVPLR